MAPNPAPVGRNAGRGLCTKMVGVWGGRLSLWGWMSACAPNRGICGALLYGFEGFLGGFPLFCFTLAGSRPGGRHPFLSHDKKGRKETCPAATPPAGVPSLRACRAGSAQTRPAGSNTRSPYPPVPPSTRRVRGGKERQPLDGLCHPKWLWQATPFRKGAANCRAGGNWFSTKVSEPPSDLSQLSSQPNSFSSEGSALFAGGSWLISDGSSPSTKASKPPSDLNQLSPSLSKRSVHPQRPS
jgi:hypothetical protein